MKQLKQPSPVITHTKKKKHEEKKILTYSILKEKVPSVPSGLGYL